MPLGETEESLSQPEAAVYAMALTRVIPVVLGGNYTIALPDATGVARHGRR